MQTKWIIICIFGLFRNKAKYLSGCYDKLPEGVVHEASR